MSEKKENVICINKFKNADENLRKKDYIEKMAKAICSAENHLKYMSKVEK